MKKISRLFLIAFIFYACQENGKNTTSIEKKPDLPIIQLQPIPTFNADSAYFFVEKQVKFGPRVPNTQAHRNCGNWIVSKLLSYNALVTEQTFETKAFDGTKLSLKNIIASFNPGAKKRILLAAHWDTRPFADHDPEKTRQSEPFDGANDGGSGVGVLLEIARLLGKDSLQPNVGIDLIFFDGEDYGEPDYLEDVPPAERGKNWWCLGSQHWSENKHLTNYTAYYGILLDMVGAPNAKFYKEGFSMSAAPSVVNKVWNIARQLGYQDRFIDQTTPEIMDDHYFVNTIGKINMIDIIEYDNTDGIYFNQHWHTHKDNMNNIDRTTLEVVGKTVLQTVYNE
jgi:Zn-dependent M28 family amino/carboxypeptidase